MTNRKLSASILIVGCAETKRPILLAKAIIKPTDTTTAAIMISTRSTMPTAVMIESSEKNKVYHDDLKNDR